jgi:hypothetical protein
MTPTLTFFAGLVVRIVTKLFFTFFDYLHERQITKRLKYSAIITDRKNARDNNNILFKLIQTFFISATMLFVFLGITWSAKTGIPIVVEINHHNGFFKSLFSGAYTMTYVAIHGFLLPHWTPSIITAIAGYLVGGVK